MKKLNRRMVIMGVLFVCILALSGCSAVFTGTVTGRLLEKGTTDGINDKVEVYIFLSESEYNAAKEALEASSDADLSVSSLQVYTAALATSPASAAGTFTCKVYWETLFPTFGKTADRRLCYVLYVGETLENGWADSRYNPRMITSGSTLSLPADEAVRN